MWLKNNRNIFRRVTQEQQSADFKQRWKALLCSVHRNLGFSVLLFLPVSIFLSSSFIHSSPSPVFSFFLSLSLSFPPMYHVLNLPFPVLASFSGNFFSVLRGYILLHGLQFQRKKMQHKYWEWTWLIKVLMTFPSLYMEIILVLWSTYHREVLYQKKKREKNVIGRWISASTI